MQYTDILVRSGLSEREAVVYSALLERGLSSLSDISKDTGINRPALYVLLPKMTARGIIGEIKKGKRTHYLPESPAKLLEQYRAAQARLETSFSDMEDQFQTLQSQKPQIKMFEGQRDMLRVFDDAGHSLPREGILYRYTGRTGEVTDRFLENDYIRLRKKKKIERYAIAGEDKAKGKEKKLDRHVRAIPKDFDLFEDNVSLLIYADKTAYIDYNTNTSFIIESPIIARFQEKLFKLLWKQLPKT